MKRAVFLAAMLIPLAAIACAQSPVEGFDWRDAEGAERAFHQAASWEAGREGRFGPGRLENRYRLDQPYETEPGRCLEVTVTASSAASGSTVGTIGLSLASGKRGDIPVAEADFPLRGRISRFVLPLPEKSIVGQLTVTLKAAGSTAGSGFPQVAIDAIADCEAYRGYSIDAEGPRVSSEFSFVMSGGENMLEIERPFDAARNRAEDGDKASRQALVVEYAKAPETARLLLSGTAAGGEGSDLTLRTRSGGARIVLGPQVFPAGLGSLKLRAPVGIELRAFYVGAVSAVDFELADLGRILRSSPASLEADYDLYRWDLAPDVLVFDFKDYGVQDDYLKRLAFFAEKAGYRGTLQRDEVIGPLHGWNAHDYRPEDLAAFFSAARERGFPLNDRERSFERLLVERGILVERGAKLGPGRGAIISIARESPSHLRRTFIVHESTHALYFTDGRYRDFVSAKWASMDEGEKWFWKRYFRWMAYDTKSEYLMANEYQAYLVQQPLAKAREYFTKTLPSNLLVPDVVAREPDLSAQVEEYMAEYGDRFAERAAELEAWLYRTYGISAGRSYFLD